MLAATNPDANMKLRRYESGAPDTPAVLRRCAEAGSVPAVTSKGNLDLLDRKLIGLFCSVRCPGDVILKTYDLARALRSADVTLIGGFQSPMEKDFLELVLRGPSSVVVCPARGLDTMRIPKVWKNPLAEGRLLLLSFFDDTIRRPTADLAAERNAHVATIADRLLIAHAEKGGKTEKLCKDALAQGKQVFALDSPDNGHLLQLGVVPVEAHDPTPLIAREI